MYRAVITGPATYGEDVMAAKRTWSDLDESTRKLIITVAVAEGILKVAALIDIKRRPASQIRGPKWLWAPVVAVVNSAAVATRLTGIAARELTAGSCKTWADHCAQGRGTMPRAIGGPLASAFHAGGATRA